MTKGLDSLADHDDGCRAHHISDAGNFFFNPESELKSSQRPNQLTDIGDTFVSL
jgi:hypothetical protein